MQSWSRPKDPDDIRFLGFDWSSWLMGERTSITDSEFVVADSTVTLDQEAVAGGITRFRIQGGALGETARITNRVTFNNGEQIDHTARLRLRAG